MPENKTCKLRKKNTSKQAWNLDTYLEAQSTFGTILGEVRKYKFKRRVYHASRRLGGANKIRANVSHQDVNNIYRQCWKNLKERKVSSILQNVLMHISIVVHLKPM